MKIESSKRVKVMAEQQPQRRIEEVAPGLIRMVDGSSYVYLSSRSAEVLADKYHLPRVAVQGESSVLA
jgi:hypothetical protein